MLIYLQMLETSEDKQRFERLYSTYRGLMHHVAWKLLGSDREAEDAVHQAFLSIIKNFSKISEIDCPQTRSYIVITVERKAIDMLRARQRRAEVDLDAGLRGLEIPLPGDDGLADAMARLPAEHREILLLRFDNGYSVRELEKMLGLSRSAVQKRIQRAKAALREEYEKEGGIV